MKKEVSILVVFLLLFFLFSCDKNDDPIQNSLNFGSLNLDFEIRSYDKPSWPDYWGVGGEGFVITLDDEEKHSGILSLKMEREGDRNNNFGVFVASLPVKALAGKELDYRCWIKTKGVKNGYAGLWLRVDGVNSTLGFDNMGNRGLQGDNEWVQVSIKMNIHPATTNISFGGLFPGEGTVWYDDIELYIDKEKYIDLVPKTELSQQDIAAIKKYIYPLRTYEPDRGNTNDLEALDKLIDKSKVVALGEVSHGSSEIYKMKNRIIQYLVINNGFDIFSIEGNMPEAYKLNDYSVRGEGYPKKLIAGMYFWTWRTEEVLNMVEWMRRFNHNEQRIAFTGFDMQYYQGAVNELDDAFKDNDEIKTKISALRTKISVGYANISVNDRKEIDEILSILQNSIETSSFQKSEKEWLKQNIVIVQQYLDRSNNVLNWRDKCMADNAIWIKDHNPKSKLILWAHNGHIMKTDDVMGFHLDQKLGKDYVTFGFTFYNGHYTATGSKGLTSYEAQQAYSGTLEYMLNQLDEPIFILDMKKIKSDKQNDTKWLLESINYRRVGAVGGLENEFQRRKVADDFDYLIFIKTSTPSTLFPDP